VVIFFCDCRSKVDIILMKRVKVKVKKEKKKTDAKIRTSRGND